jgi:hypothetical protein
MMMVSFSSVFVNRPTRSAVSRPPKGGGRSSISGLPLGSASCCRLHGRGAEVHFVGCGIAEGFVNAPRVVEGEVPRQRLARIAP